MLKEGTTGERYAITVSGSPCCPARAVETFPARVLQGGLHLGRGHPRPLSSPGSWAACHGKTTLPSDPREKRKPFGFDSHRHKSFRLSSLPRSSELGAGLWWPEQLTQRRSPEPLPLPRPPTSPERPGQQPAPTCHARPSQPPEGPKPTAEAGCRRPDVAGSWSPIAVLSCSGDFSCSLTTAWTWGLVEGPAGTGVLMPPNPLS